MKLASIILYFLCTLQINAQSRDLNQRTKNSKSYRVLIEETKSQSFANRVKEIEAYYADPSHTEQRDYKKFLRWKFFAENRLDANGNIANISKFTYDAFLNQKKTLDKNKQNTSIWAKIGDNNAWENVTNELPLQRGRVDCVAVDPANHNIVYAGANTGGVWKTTDGGSHWIPITDNLPTLGVTSIVIDPSSPVNNRKIFVLMGDGGWGTQYHTTGIFVTNDGGVTWEPNSLQFDETFSFASARKLVMDPNDSNILYAVFWSEIYKTTNKGNTWTKLNIKNKNNYGFYDLEICPNDSQTLYVCERDTQFHRSTNGGMSWDNVTIPVGLSTGIAQTGIAVTKANPNVVYYLSMDNHATNNSKFAGIYKSTDKGLTFSLYEDDLPDPFFLYQQYGLAEIVVSETDENELFVGSFNTYKYASNTSEFKVIDNTKTHVDVRGLYLINERLFSCNDGGLNVSDDYINWKDISKGMLIKQIYELDTDFNNSHKIYLGTQDNGFSIVNNGIEEDISGGDVYSVSASKLFDRVYYNVGFWRLAVANTNPNEFKNTKTISRGSKPLVVYDSYTNNNVDTDALLIADGYDLKKVLVNGDFNFATTNLTNNQFDIRWNKLVVSQTDKNYFYGIGTGWSTNINRLVKSNNIFDRKPNFTDLSAKLPPFSNKISSITMSEDEPEKVWFSSGGYNASEKVFHSQDGGESWINMSAGLPNTPVNSLAYQKLEDTDIIYAATDIGVYYFMLKNNTEWLPYSSETLPKSIVNSLKYNKNDNILTAGTWGRGIWQIEAIAEVPTLLSVTPDTKTVAAAMGTTTFTVTSNVDWSVNETADWVTAVKTNPTTLTVSYDENKHITNRNATLTIFANSITKEVNLIQNRAVPNITITPETKTVAPTMGTTTFTVASNIDWSVNETADWVTAVKTNPTTITVSYDENKHITNRNATLTIFANSITKEVNLIQNRAVPNITITPETKIVAATMGTTTFTVASNIDWSVNETADWVTAVKTNPTTLTVSYDENEHTTSRNATLTIFANSITKEVNLIQNRAIPNITITPDTKTVAPTMGTTTFTVASNVDWSVNETTDWVTAVKTNPTTLTVSYDENEHITSRNATLTIFANSITKEVNLIQNRAIPNITITPDTKTVAPTMGTTTFTVASNVDWSVNETADWVTAVKTNPTTITVSYDENEHITSRNATLTIFANSITKEVNLTQNRAIPNITITPETKTVAATMGTTTFTVASNVDWSVNETADWVIAVKTNPTTLTVSYDENIKKEQRSAPINILYADKTSTISVKQKETDKTSNHELRGGTITVFPNPANEKFYLKCDTDIVSPVEVSIYNIAGDKVKSIFITELFAASPLEVDISSFQAGMYIIKINNTEIYKLKKILKN